jgi:hypothetical protein
MTYKRLIPSLVPKGGVAGPTVLASLLQLERTRAPGNEPQRAALNGWEEEGGSVAAPATAGRSS